jgi:hypothetical protein
MKPHLYNIQAPFLLGMSTLLAAVAPSATAQEYAPAYTANFLGVVDGGRWLCPACLLEIKEAETAAIIYGSEIYTFIISEVNLNLFQQIPGVTGPARGWLPGDLVSICDGKLCLQLRYHASGKFFPYIKYPDNRSKYKNSPALAPVQFAGSYGAIWSALMSNTRPAVCTDYVSSIHWSVISIRTVIEYPDGQRTTSWRDYIDNVWADPFQQTC